MLIMTSQWLIGLVYFFAAFLLIFGLWRMSSPVTRPVAFMSPVGAWRRRYREFSLRIFGE